MYGNSTFDVTQANPRNIRFRFSLALAIVPQIFDLPFSHGADVVMSEERTGLQMVSRVSLTVKAALLLQMIQRR